MNGIDWSQLFLSELFNHPMSFACVAGLGFAFAARRRHRTVSLVAATGFILLLFIRISEFIGELFYGQARHDSIRLLMPQKVWASHPFGGFNSFQGRHSLGGPYHPRSGCSRLTLEPLTKSHSNPRISTQARARMRATFLRSQLPIRPKARTAPRSKFPGSFIAGKDCRRRLMLLWASCSLAFLSQ